MKTAWLAPLGVLLMLLVVGLLTWRAFYRPDPLAEARKAGDPARIVRVAAVIDALADTGSRHNYNAVVAFTLRYTTPDGRAFTAQIERAVPPLILAQLAKGKQLQLEYDARNPALADLVEPLQLGGG